MSDDLDRDLVERWMRHQPPEHVLTRMLVALVLERKKVRKPRPQDRR